MSSPAERRKQFTVEEANRMLPLVRAIVSDIVSVASDIAERRQRWALLEHADADDPYVDEVREMKRELEERLRSCVGELVELGVELKDPLQGLVDFHAVIDGREAYLCWRLGEDEIEHWHELDAGFAGRQPLYEASVAGDTFGAADIDSASSE